MNDMEKFDTRQRMEIIRVEMLVYKKLGVYDEIVEWWQEVHESW